MPTLDRDNDAPKDASIPSLFAAVINDARDLAIGHLQHMQRETAEELGNLKHAMARIAVAAAITIVGTVLAGHAIAAALIALGLPAWVSYALTAVAAVGGGVVLVKRLPKDTKDMDLVPEESIASFRRDLTRIKEAASAAAH
jgi:TRAP-type C4-dicarboxylate transport system permease small subunit